MASGDFDALVTTDGDADRPLVADGAGRIVRGDVLGLITARYLGVDTVVVPVTAGSAIEHSGGFHTGAAHQGRLALRHRRHGTGDRRGREVRRRVRGQWRVPARIGRCARRQDPARPADPRRDAADPGHSGRRARGRLCPWPISSPRSTSARLRATGCPNTPAERSGAFLRAARRGRRSGAPSFGRSARRTRSIEQDGIRIELDGGRTIHFRASGNAPELRCYAEAKSAMEAEDLVRWGLSAAAAAMREGAEGR